MRYTLLSSSLCLTSLSQMTTDTYITTGGPNFISPPRASLPKQTRMTTTTKITHSVVRNSMVAELAIHARLNSAQLNTLKSESTHTSLIQAVPRITVISVSVF